MEARQQRSSRAAEQMMLMWDEKVEKQPIAELSLKKEVGKEKKKSGRKRRVGVIALGGGRKLSSVKWRAQSGPTRQEPLPGLLKKIQQSGKCKDAACLIQSLLVNRSQTLSSCGLPARRQVCLLTEPWLDFQAPASNPRRRSIQHPQAPTRRFRASLYRCHTAWADIPLGTPACAASDAGTQLLFALGFLKEREEIKKKKKRKRTSVKWN